jgi:hypothetical protein
MANFGFMGLFMSATLLHPGSFIYSNFTLKEKIKQIENIHDMSCNTIGKIYGLQDGPEAHPF